MKRKIILISLLLLMAVFLAACGAKDAATSEAEMTESAATSEAETVALAVDETEEEVQEEIEKSLSMMGFEEKIQKMYGTEGYLGPMMEEVELLTEEEVLEIDPDSLGGKNSVILNGKFNKTPVTDINEARKVLYSVIHLVDIPLDEATFLYGTVYEEEERKTYRFVQFYKDVMVPEGFVDMVVNGNGDTENIYCYAKTQEEIGMDSVEPKVSEEELLAQFDGMFKGYELNSHKLCILSTLTSELQLIWILLATPPGEEEKVIHIDSNTGKEIIYDEPEKEIIYDEPEKQIVLGKLEEEIVDGGPEEQNPYEETIIENPRLEKYHTYDDERVSHLYGRFTEAPIKGEQDAVNAIWSIKSWIGLDASTDTFKMSKKVEGDTGTVYYLDQYYKGIPVAGGRIVIATDEAGYGDYLSSTYMEYIDVDVEPVLEEQDLLEIFVDSCEVCEIESKELIIYDSSIGIGLTWCLNMKLDGECYKVAIDDVTGDITYIVEGHSDNLETFFSK